MIQLNEHFTRTDLPVSRPKFSPGDIVQHCRYGYRGVIVAVDQWCRADPEWYLANSTQPDREQPWYHVLVDGTEQVTYPAQQNLRPDTAGAPVQHPLLNRYFDGFHSGRYLRNGEPFPA